MKLEITDKEVYKTKVYTIEGENGDGFVVTVHDSFMDFITNEIQVVDFNNNEIDDKELIDELLTFIKEYEDEGPEFDSAGFSIADRFDDDEDELTHHCDDLDCNCSI